MVVLIYNHMIDDMTKIMKCTNLSTIINIIQYYSSETIFPVTQCTRDYLLYSYFGKDH